MFAGGCWVTMGLKLGITGFSRGLQLLEDGRTSTSDWSGQPCMHGDGKDTMEMAAVMFLG